MSFRDPICLECWVPQGPLPHSDPFHFYCTGEHVVPATEADEIRDWITGRYRFMVETRQVYDDGARGAVV